MSPLLFFPRLRYLSLGPENLSALLPSLSPAAFPSLRYLAIGRGLPKRLSHQAHLVLLELLPQLEALTTPFAWFELHDTLLAPVSYKVLVDCQGGHTDLATAIFSSRVQHLRLLHPQSNPINPRDTQMLHKVEDLVQMLEQPRFEQSSLRSVYLDFALRPASFSSVTSLVTHSFIESLIMVCENKGIEVVFEEQQKDEKVDSPISKEFFRRMKDIRRRQSAEVDRGK
jgi:hypothetical protein